MLRPATPLTVILLIAFVLTLLSVLSAPIIKSIPLGTYKGTNFGVFGYCDSGSNCVFQLGYSAPGDSSNDGAADNNFDIDANSTRHTLTNILIVHPVACLFQLICVVLSLVAHFHSPSHSSRYLLGLIIFMLPTLLLTLLSFLVDILLFIPHVGWAGWLVLGAVVLDVLGGIMLCAMRRTLVSRKARKKRIAENAEMSGENFYNRQATERSNTAPPGARADSPPPLESEPTVPMVNGAPGADKLPQFATYEQRRVSDDRMPLNERTQTTTTTSSGFERPSQDGSEYYAPGPGRGGPVNRGRGGRPYGPPRDEFANPLPPSAAFGPRGPEGRGGFRGRGGPGVGPRGGYGGRGAPGYGPSPGPGRGGPGRGGMGPAFGAGAAAGALAGSRGPPPGYTNDDYPMQDRPPMNGYGPRRQSPGPPSAPGYGRRQSPGPPSAPGYGRSPSAGRQRSPGPPSAPGYGQPPEAQDNDPYARAESPPPLPGSEVQYAPGVARAESPPPLAPPPGHAIEMGTLPEPVIGMAVEMDERTGSPAQTPTVVQGGFGRVDSPLRQNFHAPQSPSSMYSSQPSHRAQESVPYVPARAAWQSQSQSQSRQTPTAELAGTAPRVTQANDSHQRKASESYYEDIDPRYSHEQQTPLGMLSPAPGTVTAPPPIRAPPGQQYLAPQSKIQHNNSYNSYDSTSHGPVSVDSHFTSISERGVNPSWEGYDQQGPAPNKGPSRQDVLQSNPDFQLPAGGRGRGGATGGQGGYGAAAY